MSVITVRQHWAWWSIIAKAIEAILELGALVETLAGAVLASWLTRATCYLSLIAIIQVRRSTGGRRNSHVEMQSFGSIIQLLLLLRFLYRHRLQLLLLV